MADPDAATGSSFGRIASVDQPGFVVSVEGNNRMVACIAARRGVAWDFADPPTRPSW